MKITLAMLGALALAGCGGTGSCVASGGVVDSCKPEWTEEECQEWDEMGVNGATWTFSGSSCEDLGFPATCPDGTHVRSPGDC